MHAGKEDFRCREIHIVRVAGDLHVFVGFVGREFGFLHIAGLGVVHGVAVVTVQQRIHSVAVHFFFGEDVALVVEVHQLVYGAAIVLIALGIEFIDNRRAIEQGRLAVLFAVEV